MIDDERKTPEDLGMREILGQLAGGLQEGSALQAEVEKLHAVVYTAPVYEVAEVATRLAKKTKGRPGAGRYPYDLLEAAEQL